MDLALSMLARYLRDHPEQAARELERIAPEECAAILADHSPDHAAPVLHAMAAIAGAEALELMETPSAIALLCRIPAGLATVLLRRISLPSRESLLLACPDPWGTAIRECARVPGLSVGAMMETRAPVFPEDWTVAEVRDRLTARPALFAGDIFVTDRDHRLRGRIELRRLFEHGGNRALSGILQPDVPTVAIHGAVRFLHDDPLWERCDVLPVVDGGGLFAGVLSHRALRSLASPAAAGPAEPGVVLVDIAELAWTGCVAAIDVAASIAPLKAASKPRGAG
ncbi:MAG: CBS domain-containing protein [Bryobacteraceae bacterium]